MPEDQRFTLDDVAEYDDGLLIEIAGAAADKARKSEKGAEDTDGQIVIASVRIENGSKHNFDARPIMITAVYGDGVAATEDDAAGSSSAASPVWSSPRTRTSPPSASPSRSSELGQVTFYLDPDDDEHDPVSFTGKIRRL